MRPKNDLKKNSYLRNIRTTFARYGSRNNALKISRRTPFGKLQKGGGDLEYNYAHYTDAYNLAWAKLWSSALCSGSAVRP